MPQSPPPLPPPAESNPALSPAQWTQHVRARYREFLISRVPAPGFGVAHLIGGVISMLTVIGIPFGLWHLYRAFKPRRVIPDGLKQELAFVERATLVFASPLMVNSLIRSPGEHLVPGLFLLTFDPAASARPDLVSDVALRVLLPDPSRVPAADVRYLEDLMADEEYQACRRRRLPDSVTSGHAFYAIDLALSSWYLPNRALADDLPGVPCLAEPGEQGCARQVPYWCAFVTPPPSWAASCPALLA